MEHLGYEHLVLVSGELRVRLEGEEIVLHEETRWPSTPGARTSS